MTTPATAALAAATGLPEYTETLPCEKASARKARILIDQALSAWDLAELIEDGQVIVSELVANSVEHTGCRLLRVTISRLAQGRVRVAVVDKSTRQPTPRTAAVDDEDGRGLAIVAALAEKTGTDTFGWGKRAWAELAMADAGQ
ncbi:ATP-binding protein [Streptomyces graminilatus]|uniref:ATP-binding protein n=1 Tax=Streptomyces graminilatus TaxID=1464070 RepID=UPI0006E32242|nr:ATP-binding protein [Streptomyces graminilatus]